MRPISTPHISVNAQPILMKLQTYNYCPKTTRDPSRQTAFRSDDVGGLGEYPAYHCKVSFVVFFGLFVTLTGRTGSPILTICTSFIWLLSIQPCAFWGFRWYVSLFILWSHIPARNPNFGGVTVWSVWPTQRRKISHGDRCTINRWLEYIGC